MVIMSIITIFSTFVISQLEPPYRPPPIAIDDTSHFDQVTGQIFDHATDRNLTR